MEEKHTEPSAKSTWSLEIFLRKLFKGVIDPIASLFIKMGLKPNTITAMGFILTILAAYFTATGRFLIAGLILLVGAPLDVVDGSMARLQGEPTRFGGFIDSVTDRYSELVLLLGLLFYYVQQQNLRASLLVFIAAAGSVMVSYTKARAESLGFTAKVGLLTRVERMIIMVAFLLIKRPIIALWIISIGANITAIQRMWFVYKQSKEQVNTGT
ncbi:MAG TPA: CDP-alcohol phosphatidyltransferase family protein [Anaerolineaceae bacterium]|nr:CDP-alcohol phosphatidyltransferase family protein [Anaerolineaceae bacterium]